MKFSSLIMLALIGLLIALVAVYHDQLWLYFSTLFCLLQNESVGCK